MKYLTITLLIFLAIPFVSALEVFDVKVNITTNDTHLTIVTEEGDDKSFWLNETNSTGNFSFVIYRNSDYEDEFKSLNNTYHNLYNEFKTLNSTILTMNCTNNLYNSTLEQNYENTYNNYTYYNGTNQICEVCEEKNKDWFKEWALCDSNISKANSQLATCISEKVKLKNTETCNADLKNCQDNLEKEEETSKDYKEDLEDCPSDSNTIWVGIFSALGAAGLCFGYFNYWKPGAKKKEGYTPAKDTEGPSIGRGFA